jgi:hypothetical protein
MVVHASNPSTEEPEDHKFKTSLSYLVSHCSKKNPKTKKKEKVTFIPQYEIWQIQIAFCLFSLKKRSRFAQEWLIKLGFEGVYVSRSFKNGWLLNNRGVGQQRKNE